MEEATMELKRSDLHDYQDYCVEFVETHPESMLIQQECRVSMR